MIKAAECRRNAQECREQAKRMQRLEDKDALERLARIWEKIADVRDHRELELEATKSSHAPRPVAAQ